VGDDVVVAEVDARPIDSRDTDWEVCDPAYRVTFWRRRVGGGWGARDFEVSGGDVGLVVDWATHHADVEETFTMFVVVGRAGERGLVRLAGVDPTRADDA
jgi:hypothetical protein